MREGARRANAQEHKHAATDKVQPPSGVAAMDQAMMAERKKMMADMKAADHRLDDLLCRIQFREWARPSRERRWGSLQGFRCRVDRRRKPQPGRADDHSGFDTSAFRFQPFGAFGNAGEGVLVMPGVNNWDLSLLKDFRLTRDVKLQFRGEFLNAFNHPNYGFPGMVIGTPQFGVISTARDARSIQLALKLNW